MNQIISTIIISVILAFSVDGMIDIGFLIKKSIEHRRLYKHKRYKNYIEYNPNPTQNNIGDCQLRAICKLFNFTWAESYDLIGKLCKEFGTFPGDYETIKKFFKYCGGYESSDAFNGYTFKKFIELNPKGTYALISTTHIVAVVNGKLYDTFDSSNFKIANVFYKKY